MKLIMVLHEGNHILSTNSNNILEKFENGI